MNEELVFEMCLKSKSKNPIEIVQSMMDLEECRIHGPEHHLLVGSALLTAYKNAGGEIDLPEALKELQNRAKNVPVGACGFWGACGNWCKVWTEMVESAVKVLEKVLGEI